MRDLSINEDLALSILKKMSDKDIAKEFGLTIIRKGCFA